jgi:beta-N-acetylhexosaminidase
VFVRISSLILTGCLAVGCQSATQPANSAPLGDEVRASKGNAPGRARGPAAKQKGGKSLAQKPRSTKQLITPPTKCGARFDTAKKVIDKKSDRELAQSLFVIQVFGSTATKSTPTEASANLALYGKKTPAEVLSTWHPAGVILIGKNAQDPKFGQTSTGNIGTGAQLTALTKGLRQIDPKLLVSTDQEGGRVNRLRPIIGRQPSARSIADDKVAVQTNSEDIANTLRSYGINMDFAPVADVVAASAGNGSIIGDRSFGSDPEVVSNRVGIVVDALQGRKVAAVAKHWPGHGSSLTDSHISTPTLSHNGAQLEAIDLLPFNVAVEHNVAAIMVGHLAVPDWDPSGRPASLSPEILSRLRNTFCGVIVTDSLWMGGFRSGGNDADASLATLNAGSDLLLMPVDLAKSVDRIEQAAKKDPAVRARLVDAATRIAVLRDTYAVG